MMVWGPLTTSLHFDLCWKVHFVGAFVYCNFLTIWGNRSFAKISMCFSDFFFSWQVDIFQSLSTAGRSADRHVPSAG
jgi:hypothetical protein